MTTLRTRINELPSELKYIIMGFALEPHPCKKEIEANDGGRYMDNYCNEGYTGYWKKRKKWERKLEIRYLYEEPVNYQCYLNANYILFQLKQIQNGIYKEVELKKFLKENKVMGRSKIDLENDKEVVGALLSI